MSTMVLPVMAVTLILSSEFVTSAQFAMIPISAKSVRGVAKLVTILF